MSTRIILPAALLALTSVIAAARWSAPDPAPREVPGARPAPPPSAPTAAPAPRPDARSVTRASWRLRFDFAAGGDADRTGRLAGTWTTEPLTDGRIAVRLHDASVTGARLDAEALAAGAELVPDPDGATLAALGFRDPGIPASHRRLYAELASLLWLTEGAGERWHAVEEGPVGAYFARYRREGQAITRAVDGLTAHRVPGGLIEADAGRIDYAQRARFSFDSAGLAAVRVEVRVQRPGLPGAAPSEATGLLTLERVATTQVPPRAGVTRPEPLGAHLDPAVLRAAADFEAVGEADLFTLMTDVEAALGGAPQAQRDRARHRLTALLRLDPAVAGAVADAIRGAPADRDRASLLLGALGSAETEAGVDALAGLVGDAALDPRIRRGAIDHISFGQRSTPTAVDALFDALDGEHDRAAAAALGSQARLLAEADPDAAAALIDTLLERVTHAADDGARADALRALGNSGSPLALPCLRGMTAALDPALSEAAIYALRFIPDGGVDALLERLLGVGGGRQVAAIRAIAFRDPTIWRDRLTAARFDDGSRAAQAAQRVLGGWL